MKDLSMHLMDILQNSISAEATNITVSLITHEDSGMLIFEVNDNGIGMDADFVNKVMDPFITTRTTRRVGLGIPLLKSSAEMAGGDLILSSVKGKGTKVRASFKISHIDRVPLGDIGETIASTIAAYPGIELDLNLCSSRCLSSFKTQEVREKLGGVPINHYNVIAWIKDFINEDIKITFGGVLNEIVS